MWACWQIVALRHHSKAVSDQWTFLWSLKLWWRKSVTTKSSQFSVLLCERLEGLAEDTGPGSSRARRRAEGKNVNHRFLEYTELDRTRKVHQVHLLALQGTTQGSHHVPESTVQTLPGLSGWCCDHFLGESVPVLTHTLGERTFAWYPGYSTPTDLCCCPGCCHGSPERRGWCCPSSCPHEEAADLAELSPEFSLFQAEPAKWAHSLLIWLPLYTFLS